MGNRVHIVETYKWTPVRQDGASVGYDLSVRYSQKQGCLFKNDSFSLANWFNDYADLDCWIDCGKNEWNVRQDELENIPEEAFKHPITDRTEEEMRRFIAECIRCAKLTDGECHMEWF